MPYTTLEKDVPQIAIDPAFRYDVPELEKLKKEKHSLLTRCICAFGSGFSVGATLGYLAASALLT